eukprot:CAMPEP_0195285814 /NCGR_PEP_ID=MMETSP0707-20130614/3513_1 /TAXON_ID=33640 /ORGANISM="Asterionellopsis glacialis, Strain CCMP134" /LENGTH=233 /DNA_ID=CAMNT_0040345367 /DNA_START=68 /DNA_END=769 /DNA_ORIENTATION=-
MIPTQHEQVLFKGYAMKNIASPNSHDVLLGRGGMTNKHCGNIQYRRLVANNKTFYNAQISRSGKTNISKSIVRAIRHQFPPGRFLQKDPNGLWYDVGNTKATLKTSQALREASKNESSGEVDTKKKIVNSEKPKAVDLAGDNRRSVEVAAAMLMLSDPNDQYACQVLYTRPRNPTMSNITPLWPRNQNVNVSKLLHPVEKLRSLQSELLRVRLTGSKTPGNIPLCNKTLELQS